MTYFIDPTVEQTLTAYLMSRSIERRILSDKLAELDYPAAIALCEQSLTCPNASEGCITSLTLLAKRLAIAESHYGTYKDFVTALNGEYDLPLKWSDSKEADEDDLLVFSGILPITLFGDDLIKSDWVALGFPMLHDFVFALGAHIVNLKNFDHNNSKYIWDTQLTDGSIVRNRFSRCTHSDFRFSQSVITPIIVQSPFKDSVSFFKPQVRMISAYHSSETSFLATFLRFALQTNTYPLATQDYDTFFSEFLSGEVAGHDAGVGRSDVMMQSLLIHSPIPNDREEFNVHSIAREQGGWIFPVLEELELVYYPSRVRLSIVDINHLIKGLHLACKDGFYRTTIFNLRDFMLEVQEDFIKLQNGEVVEI